MDVSILLLILLLLACCLVPMAIMRRRHRTGTARGDGSVRMPEASNDEP